jgi:hypothetical protein
MDIRDFKSKFLTCCECNRDFLFDIGEQSFFASKQLSEPKRCPECRKLRKLTLVPDRQVQREY